MKYNYEPSDLEVIVTQVTEKILLNKYYNGVIKELDIKPNERVLDYCAGSGMIAKKIAKKLKVRELVYGDVSKKWLEVANRKLHHMPSANGVHIKKLTVFINNGNYDKVLIHFSLHDFPSRERVEVMKQLAQNLSPTGKLFIREPIGEKHGMKVHELINIIEGCKGFSYDYQIKKSLLIGNYIDCWCKRK